METMLIETVFAQCDDWEILLPRLDILLSVKVLLYIGVTPSTTCHGSFWQTGGRENTLYSYEEKYDYFLQVLFFSILWPFGTLFRAPLELGMEIIIVLDFQVRLDGEESQWYREYIHGRITLTELG